MDRYREDFKRLDEFSPRSSVQSEIGGRSSLRFSMPGFGYDSFNPLRSFMSGLRKSSGRLKSLRHPNPSGAPKTAFAEDLKSFKKNIFDPQQKFLLRMNRFFFLSCIFAVAVDPLFFFLPVIDNSNCIGIDKKLAVTSTVVRTIIDSVYLIRVFLQFRTAYVAPSSRVFGSGELVIDPTLIAMRYIKSYFLMDFFALLPLPQIVVWRYLHSSDGPDVLATKDALVWVVLCQYIPRLLRIFPVTKDLKRTAGVFIETAWAGAGYYLLWFMLAGHNVGTLWYFLSIERKDSCWLANCHATDGCEPTYLYCSENHGGSERYKNWSTSTPIFNQCNGTDESFNFGIYQQALVSGILGPGNFVSKSCYCFWWGLQNLSTLGQGFVTSTYPWEVLFSIAICILGLILFALLIGNMQTYLQSVAIRLEEMRVKKRDAEQWMHHRSLPPDIRERVRRYERYRWLETRGVDEENLVQTLPKDLRRDIKRHLCLGLVKRVPLFENMDERLLDAICERLRPALYTEHEYILREGDPVDEMQFILHGSLESVTTDGGRSGFFNKVQLKEGSFCGDELLTWALDPKSGANFPVSSRTVKALSEVEAFSLRADELKFVASQFRRLHSRQVQHTFRFYSQQWRTWGACFIQAAWRRYYKRKMAEQRRREEEAANRQSSSSSGPSLGATIYASRFAANALRGVHRLRSKAAALPIVRVPKPSEPDFGVDVDDAD
ncbi:putative cyclic nucleotide-gated ion channel 8 [Aegilops tauschii subsp. strangulata]|uniref:Cyclic nucleotide-binding domain-containing protein n=2 Tax=Aegilops tauschii subsp. strangulata TaxID=200361 RepID=A0A453D9C0_AEGTS|nr:probable cyclic nucleotide-gated ion channel 5 [Aegilops tauschii subsp. strangulata]